VANTRRENRNKLKAWGKLKVQRVRGHGIADSLLDERGGERNSAITAPVRSGLRRVSKQSRDVLGLGMGVRPQFSHALGRGWQLTLLLDTSLQRLPDQYYAEAWRIFLLVSSGGTLGREHN
jgi:hypothetical protein